jgi:hypothetical protein
MLSIENLRWWGLYNIQCPMRLTLGKSIDAQSTSGLYDRPGQNLIDRSIHLAKQAIQLVLNILPPIQLARPLPIRRLSRPMSWFTIHRHFSVPMRAKPPPSRLTVLARHESQ